MTALVFMLIVGVALGWFGHREWLATADEDRREKLRGGKRGQFPWET